MAFPSVGRVVMGPSGDVSYGMTRSRLNNVTVHFLKPTSDESEVEISKENTRKGNSDETIQRVSELRAGSDLRAVAARIDRLVELGLDSYERDLEYKRNKLKVQLFTEQMSLTTEYTTKAQNSAQAALESERQLVKRIESRAAADQRAFTEKAYERMFRENCDELRTKLQVETRKSLNSVHLLQMRERTRAAVEDREEERMWIALEAEEGERKRRREGEEKAMAVKNFNDYSELLAAQLKDLDHRQREDARAEMLSEAYRERYWASKESEWNQRDEDAVQRHKAHYRDLQQQIKERSEVQDNSKQDQYKRDRDTVENDRRSHECEKTININNLQLQRAATNMFVHSVNLYRKEQALADKEMAEVVLAEDAKNIAQQTAARQKILQQRRDLTSSCLEVRSRQVAEKTARCRAAKEAEIQEAETLRKQLDCPELSNLERQRHDRDRELTKMNTALEEYAMVLKKRELNETQTYVRKRKIDEMELERKQIAMLNLPHYSAGIVEHPFIERLVAHQGDNPLT